MCSASSVHLKSKDAVGFRHLVMNLSCCKKAFVCFRGTNSLISVLACKASGFKTRRVKMLKIKMLWDITAVRCLVKRGMLG